MSTLLAASIPLDTDGTLAANSDSKVATQKATKTYADTKGVVNGQQIFDGGHVLAADFSDIRSLYDTGGNKSVRWQDGLLAEASAGASIDWAQRQLIANDGSTTVVDWSDPAGVALGTIKSGNGANLTGVSAATVTGTATNDNAAAGIVGEYVSSLIAVGSATSLTTATAKNVTSISLTAGDWDVEGLVSFTEGTATVSARTAGINTSTATIPTDGSEGYCGVQSTLTSELNSITLPRKRISIASTTTVYLVGKATFSAGSCSGFGAINARRVR